MNKILLLLLPVCAWAQSGLNRPSAGKMLDASGSVRAVYGISASFTLGEAELIGVLSAACSATVCVAKTDASIISGGGQIAAPSGPALFSFDSGNVYVWFQASRQLARFDGASLTFLNATVDGDILAIGASNGAVQFAVKRRSGVWIVNQDGSAAGSLPRDTIAVTFSAAGLAYAGHDQIVIGTARFALSGVTALLPMSGSYVQAVANGANYALRIDPGRESISQLPGTGAAR